MITNTSHIHLNESNSILQNKKKLGVTVSEGKWDLKLLKIKFCESEWELGNWETNWVKVS